MKATPFPARATGVTRLLLAVAALLAATGCRNTMLDMPQPVVRSTLALEPRPGLGDTVQVAITLGSGPVRALGSLTAALVTTGDWRFVACAAAQGEPLLACKAHEGRVRVASAWAAGTHTGDLLTLTFVRTSPSAAPTWQWTVQEVHGVGGESLLEALDVTSLVPGADGGR
jgi:hypothetical protein